MAKKTDPFIPTKNKNFVGQIFLLWKEQKIFRQIQFEYLNEICEVGKK